MNFRSWLYKALEMFAWTAAPTNGFKQLKDTAYKGDKWLQQPLFSIGKKDFDGAPSFPWLPWVLLGTEIVTRIHIWRRYIWDSNLKFIFFSYYKLSTVYFKHFLFKYL